MGEIEVRSIATQLLGVDVLCTVDYSRGEEPTVGVEMRASSLDCGIRSVSRFAGYCRRSLVLCSPTDAEAEWAKVLASYFGFGLAIEDGGLRRDVMPAPEMDTGPGRVPQQQFLRRVLQRLAESD